MPRPSAPSPARRDRDRKLTKRGRDDAPVIGAYMARHGLNPDLALVSPAKRAQETWALVAPAFAKAPRLRQRRAHLQRRRPRPCSRSSARRAARTVLLVVGHNPGLHDIAVQLIASGDVDVRERVAEKLPTSGLVVIDLAFDDWSRLHLHSGRLERYVTPRLIAAATD